MAQERSEEQWPPGGPLRVLIADDDRDDVELCLAALKKAGVRVAAEFVASRGAFAQKLRDSSYDMILSDYHMGDWTGADALTIAQELRPDVPILLMSGALGDELAVESIKKGFTDYVLKGQLARLPMAVRRAYEERSLREGELRATRALKESERRYRALVDNANYGIYWVKAGGELLFVNPALVNMLGFPSAQELLAQLLAFARRQILEPRNIDLNQSVVDTLNLLETILGSNLEIRADLAPVPALVTA